jgi:hypothetical protein
MDASDIYERDKQRFFRSLYAYVPCFITTGLCSYALESTTPLLQLTTASIFTWYWAYFIHRLYHYLPSTGLFYYINPHIAIHHSQEKTLPRWLELTIETVQNIFWFFLLYILQEATQIHIVPDSIILLSLFVYASVHNINYSIFGSEKHKEQHLNPDVNFGPDFLDHTFGTNSDEEYENMVHFIPNSILSYILILWLRRWTVRH